MRRYTCWAYSCHSLSDEWGDVYDGLRLRPFYSTVGVKRWSDRMIAQSYDLGIM
ncbi:hypothetical protein [Nostoc sp. FACHB-888]|uniref:hypothetical protein n=1 Tax=Nostoc sp. FACHB-888 TaxID=2692842 RepID=UPI0016892152|nr:hypothetical protein [Nostoc sp. FACHB-888]MBD2244274.1 hypothetical protein [Nostoc sp. FACHB-888]